MVHESNKIRAAPRLGGGEGVVWAGPATEGLFWSVSKFLTVPLCPRQSV